MYYIYMFRKDLWQVDYKIAGQTKICVSCNRLLDIECLPYGKDLCVQCRQPHLNWPDQLFRCGLCDRLLPVVYFHRDNYLSSGFRSQCRRDVKRRNQRDSYTINVLRERTRLYDYSQSPGRVRSNDKRLRGKPSRQTRRKAESEGNILPNYMNHLIAFYGFGCMRPGCSFEIDACNTLSFDHVLPIALGGRHDYENAQLLCKRCNSSKSAKHLDYRPEVLTLDFVLKNYV